MPAMWYEIRDTFFSKGLLLKCFEMVLLAACTCIHLGEAESMRVPLAIKIFPIVIYCSFTLVTFIRIFAEKGRLPEKLELILHSAGSVLTAGSGGIVFNIWLCRASHEMKDYHPLLLAQSLLSFLVAVLFFAEFSNVLVKRYHVIDKRNMNTVAIESRNNCSLQEYYFV